MMDNRDKDDEIDLLNIYKKVMIVFKGRLLLFFTCIIIGIIFGFAYYKFTSKTYKSRMVVASSLFQASSFVIIMDHLQLLLEEKNYDQLAHDLNINKETAEKIKKIEVEASKNYTRDNFGSQALFEEEKSALIEKSDYKKVKKEEYVIEVLVKDKAILKILQDGIVYYLSNHPSIKERAEVMTADLSEVNKDIQKQIVQLDSLKKSIETSFGKKEVARDVFIGDPGKIYLDLIQLHNSKISTNQELFDAKIRVVQNFPVYLKQNSPRLGISLLVSTLFSMILFVIIAVSLVKKEESA